MNQKYCQKNIESDCYGTVQNSDISTNHNLQEAYNNNQEKFLEIELDGCPYETSFLMMTQRFGHYNLHLSGYYCHIQSGWTTNPWSDWY